MLSIKKTETAHRRDGLIFKFILLLRFKLSFPLQYGQYQRKLGEEAQVLLLPFLPHISLRHKLQSPDEAQLLPAIKNKVLPAHNNVHWISYCL